MFLRTVPPTYGGFSHAISLGHISIPSKAACHFSVYSNNFLRILPTVHQGSLPNPIRAAISKVVNLVGSGIGLAREISVARQPTSTISTQLPATGDTSQKMAARRDFRTRNRQDKEQGAQTNYRDCLADFRDDHFPGQTGTATSEKEWESHDPANTWTSSPSLYSCAEEYEGSANRVTSPVQQHSSLRSTTVRGRLSCPVIIAQRRPEDKECGFVRAYAPALLDCGIDEAIFLDFVDSLNKASEFGFPPFLPLSSLSSIAIGKNVNG